MGEWSSQSTCTIDVYTCTVYTLVCVLTITIRIWAEGLHLGAFLFLYYNGKDATETLITIVK